MSTSNRLLTAALLVPPLILLQQHLRLQSTYPTHRTTPSLEISPRSDNPATAPAWRRTHAGDEWTADVPRAWLGDGSTAPEVVFARAFWGSWPLRIERSLVQFLARNSVGPFALREAQSAAAKERKAERDFEPGAQVIGGLFMVDAHDAHPAVQPDPTVAGPIVCSWWLHSTGPTSSTSVGIAGGYHSFTVKNIVPKPATPEQDLVRLSFTSHLVLSNHPDPSGPDAPAIPSRSLAGLSTMQTSILYFHETYSRILLDLAVRRLRSGAVWPE